MRLLLVFFFHLIYRFNQAYSCNSLLHESTKFMLKRNACMCGRFQQKKNRHLMHTLDRRESSIYQHSAQVGLSKD